MLKLMKSICYSTVLYFLYCTWSIKVFSFITLTGAEYMDVPPPLTNQELDIFPYFRQITSISNLLNFPFFFNYLVDFTWPVYWKCIMLLYFDKIINPLITLFSLIINQVFGLKDHNFFEYFSSDGGQRHLSLKKKSYVLCTGQNLTCQ